MKKKLIFAITTGFFAVATVFNMTMLQANSSGDVSLESIMIMQQAEAESSANPCGSTKGYCYDRGWRPFIELHW
ncbi:hypothetical protein [Alkalitalea saponilacus]|uniref:NVEALA protein n=1 Tax=Alkalitalea saponilacus TaxID=889453 RepID=A0A1T5GDN9_9BACT|nr:hypothetical protein [Alkalitalea saponilacus]ASB47937.1 hypothetical protein CDL62_01610 [Alkalitalea saponilacus]SKC06492.1 hypothetical protein SAMN03080601_01825 [Alkalitalea saponilacus]